MLSFPTATTVAQDTTSLDGNLVAVFVMNGSRIVTSGTGFALDNKGHVATATHLAIHRDAEIRVVRAGFPMGDPVRGLPAKVVQADETTHIALLKVEGLGMSGVRLRSSPLTVGMRVVAVGYPRLQGAFDQTINRFHVTARIRNTKGENPSSRSHALIHYEADTDPGGMGGPILDHCGNVGRDYGARLLPILRPAGCERGRRACGHENARIGRIAQRCVHRLTRPGAPSPRTRRGRRRPSAARGASRSIRAWRDA